MERLTTPNYTYYSLDFMEDGISEMANKLSKYEDTGLTPEQILAMDEEYTKLAKELGEYKRLEEQGRLVKLPCKVGDKFYFVEDGYIYDFKADAIMIRKENGKYIFCMAYMDFKEGDFGKTVFLTKSEAEKALEEMKGE